MRQYVAYAKLITSTNPRRCSHRGKVCNIRDEDVITPTKNYFFCPFVTLNLGYFLSIRLHYLGCKISDLLTPLEVILIFLNFGLKRENLKK